MILPETARDEEIRSIAYRLWEDEGRPEGRQLEHWLRAEAFWREQQGRGAFQGQPEPPSKPTRRKKIPRDDAGASTRKAKKNR